MGINNKIWSEPNTSEPQCYIILKLMKYAQINISLDPGGIVVTDMRDMNNGAAVVPSRACRVMLHCCSRSPGSDVGKNTAAGRPPPLWPGKSNRKPTADRRACHPGTPPTFPEERGHVDLSRADIKVDV